MFKAGSGLRWFAVPVFAIASVLVVSTAASADVGTQAFQFKEETAEAFWGPQHVCADGSVVGGTLLVQTTRFIEAPATEDPDPTARIQFLAVCPGGFSFSWGAPAAPATLTSEKRLKRVTATGSATARDNLGVSHQVTFDVTYLGTGPLEKTVFVPGSIRKERTATANARVTFDGVVVVDGPADHPTRPAPFIRLDIER